MSIFMTINRQRSWVLGVCAAMTLGACSSERPTAESGSVALNAPARLAQSRALNSELLWPRVTLDDGREVVMNHDGSQWRGTIEVQRDSTHQIVVQWLEPWQGQVLELARVSRLVQAGNSGTTLNLEAADYDYAIDFDADGFSNLTEREAGSDPLSATSTPTGGLVNAGGGDSEADGETPSDNHSDSDSDNNGPVVDDDGETAANGDGETDTSENLSVGEGSGPAPDTESATAQVRIPYVDPGDAPLIDGLGFAYLGDEGEMLGEWAEAVQFDVNGQGLFIDRLIDGTPVDAEDGAPLRRWAAVHDGKYLYLAVLVDDGQKRYSDSELIHNDDSLQVLVRGQNNQPNARSINMTIALSPQHTEDANDAENGRWSSVSGSVNPRNRVEFMTGPDLGPDGVRDWRFEQDVYELRIELSALGLQRGDRFGIELRINDDDDGDVRDSLWGWNRSGERVEIELIEPSTALAQLD